MTTCSLVGCVNGSEDRTESIQFRYCLSVYFEVLCCVTCKLLSDSVSVSVRPLSSLYKHRCECVVDWIHVNQNMEQWLSSSILKIMIWWWWPINNVYLKFKKLVFFVVNTNINAYVVITQNENLHYEVFSTFLVIGTKYFP